MELIKKYIYEIYKENSFTKAAQKLFISQPALSSAVSKYEKSLGFQIFDRSKNPLRVTSKGRILIEAIENIIDIETLAEKQITLIDNEHKREIVIGGTTNAAYYLFPKICAIFHKEYPSVPVRINLGNKNSGNAFQKELQDGTLDLVIDYIPISPPLKSTVICEERLVVIVPDSLVSEKLKQYAITYDELQNVNRADAPRVKDTSLFRDVSFVDFNKGSKVMRYKMEEIFGEYRTIPLIISNYNNSILHYNFAKEGVGAILTSIVSATAFFSNSDKVSYFLIDNKKAKRALYMTIGSKSLNSPLIKRVVEITKAVCEDIK